jgi:hypothetical protein
MLVFGREHSITAWFAWVAAARTGLVLRGFVIHDLY